MSFIDQTKLLEITNGGLDIILQIYPQASDCLGKKNAKFKLREEKTPSASIKKLQDGTFVVTDFGGDQTPRNAIQLVMLERNMNFKDALDYIAKQFNIKGEDAGALPHAQADFNKQDALPEQAEGEYYFETKDFEDFELQELFPAYMPEHKEKYLEVCKRYHLQCCKSYTQIKDRKALIFSSNQHFPMYFFELQHDKKIFRKIYKPREPKKEFRFFWVGGRPADYVFGLVQLRKEYEAINADSAQIIIEENEEMGVPIERKVPKVFICSGDRDALNVAYMERNVIWLNSETSELKDKVYRELTKYAEEIYNVPDLDSTGRKMAFKLAMQYLDIKTVWLPQELTKFNDRRGNPCKDITDFKKHFPYTQQWNEIVKKALPMRFWDVKPRYDRKGKFSGYGYELNNVQAYYFFSMNGFMLLKTDSNKEGFLFSRIKDNVVSEAKFRDVRAFIYNFLEERNEDIALRNAMYRTNQLSESSLQNLPLVNIDFTSYGPDHQFMFFDNCAVKITAKSIEQFSKDKVSVYIKENKVVKHGFIKLLPDFFTINTTSENYSIDIHNKESLFFQFIINTSRVYWKKEEAEEPLTELEQEEVNQHIINKIYSLGYLMHRYRDESNSYCVFAMDERLSFDDENNGGSGKSIFIKSLTHYFSVHNEDGTRKNFFENPHVFDGVNEYTDLINIDDCDKYFPFRNLFSRITGDFSVNPKGQTAFSIPFAQSPKIALTSNYTPNKIDPSTQRRIVYTAFSDYYHDNTSGEYEDTRTPRTEFGINLFSDFSAEEWNLTDNFMLQCLKFYLSHQRKINPPMKSIDQRNLIHEMTEIFKDWADMYFSVNSNKEVNKKECFEDFVGETKLKTWSSKRFNKSLRTWCIFNGYVLNPTEYANTADGRIIHKHDGVATEYVYIQVDTQQTEIDLTKF